MARRTKQEAEETRENILIAALDTIYEKGYTRSTLTDIAERIGLTKGAVYWHFKNKQDMFLSLAQSMEEQIEHALHGLYDSTYTLPDLKRMLLKTIHLIAEEEQLRKYYTIVFYRMEWTEELLAIKDFFDRQDQMMMRFVADILREAQKASSIAAGIDVEPVSRALLAFVDGLLGHCLSPPTSKAEQEQSKAVETGLDLYFAGLTTGAQAI